MKKVLIVLAVVLSITIPATAFAVTSKSSVALNFRSLCGFGVNSANLTEQQKADLTDAMSKMIALKKDIINKMIQNGTLTKEQGAQMLQQIDAMVKYHTENGFSGGMMNGNFGNGMMNGNDGYGMMNGYGGGMGMMGR